jgi:NADH:ubiquinone oxidoreductase subunit 5 (subunit L)/multisubunit Na+/H+ antiporter MnhA subunit
MLNFNTLDFSVLCVIIPYYPESVLEMISIFLFFVAVGKSAQIGLHTLLPDAM